MKMVEIDLAEMMKNGIRGDDSDENEGMLALPFAAQDLRDGLEAISTKTVFSVGDIVRQKKTCQIYNERYAGEPAIVCELISPPEIDTEQPSGSPYYRLPMDVIIGRRGAGGEFLTFHVDSSRFELIDKNDLALPGDGV